MVNFNVSDKTLPYAVSNRDLRDYKRELGITPEDMRGKSVLEIGPGGNESFARACIQQGASRVCTVAPHYSNPEFTSYLEKNEDMVIKEYGPAPERYNGTGESLPTFDTKFDFIISNWAYPYYRKLSGDLESEVQSLVNLLNPGGKIILHPLHLFTQNRRRMSAALKRIPGIQYRYKWPFKLEIELPL